MKFQVGFSEQIVTIQIKSEQSPGYMAACIPEVD